MGFITDLLKDIPLSAVLKEKLVDAERKATDAMVRAQNAEAKITTLSLLVEQKDQEIKRLREEVEYLKERQNNPPPDPGSWMAS